MKKLISIIFGVLIFLALSSEFGLWFFLAGLVILLLAGIWLRVSGVSRKATTHEGPS